jgi:hypothetical protein
MSTNERVLLWFVRLACRAGTKDFCSVLAALFGPIQNIFSHRTIFNSFVPITQQAGQAAVLGRLSLSLCLWDRACIDTRGEVQK